MDTITQAQAITDETPAQLLQKHFGFSEFRPGQEVVIDALHAHGAALAVFPTGGGKSLCYQLPSLRYEGLTLVVSPLIALMKDQIDFLQRHKIAAARLDSTLTGEEVRDVTARLENGTLKLLYVAPERFNNERFLSMLTRTKIALFAVDEAHCISEWGHNFRPDYLKLAEAAKTVQAERVLALTATATPAVVKDIEAAFNIPKAGAIVTGFYRPNLNLSILTVRAEDRDALLLKRLHKRPPGPAIVYVTLQKTAERVAALLAADGFPAEAYHAGLDDAVRSAVQDRWMASDQGIVVATIAFGMGIDKAAVRYVYHYNLPKSLESYSQEIGRAGRDGLKSTVELLACPEDIPTLENFAYGDTPTEASLKSLLDDLLSRGKEFDLALFSLSSQHDIRQLVLRTALTYLEIDGVFHQGTPFYAGYEVQPLLSLPQIIAKFQGPHADLVRDLFNYAKHGKIWYALNPDDAAAELGVERRRIIRALEYLEEQGWAKLKVADVRQRYTRGHDTEDSEALAADLAERFTRREQAEVKRLGMVLKLVTREGCQTNALVGYFGEKRTEPCGHCTFCLTGQAAVFPPMPDLPSPEDLLDMPAWKTLLASHPDALRDPRQQTRFLCGLTSPAIARARISRHALFGALETLRFADVLAWCESQ
ncbi:MAG: RecQ family ATP-dependent DNA helicase [Janthinobacterium lividum]